MATIQSKHPLMLIEWVDSFQLAAGWHWLSDLEDHQPSKCQTAGWLISEDKDKICIAETISETAGDHQISGLIAIPVCAIVSRKTLAIS